MATTHSTPLTSLKKPSCPTLIPGCRRRSPQARTTTAPWKMLPCEESGWSPFLIRPAATVLDETDLSDRSDLSVEQREEYVAAVKCLMKKPPKADKIRFPGALSRFDDFVAYHMTHAMQLHDNYHLFGSHKYFVWLYEQALRNECGYTGYQPVSWRRNDAAASCCGD